MNAVGLNWAELGWSGLADQISAKCMAIRSLIGHVLPLLFPLFRAPHPPDPFAQKNPGALGGRLDHTLSNLNTLYCYRHLNMALWGDGNLVRLLRAGRALIKPSRIEGPTCGLVPLARPATASSTGLKWDLDNTHVSCCGEPSEVHI